MEHSSKFFTDNLKQLKTGFGGTPKDPEKHNLYWGLYFLSKEVGKIQAQQDQLESLLQQLAQRAR